MATTVGINKKLFRVLANEDSLVLVPFQFTVNGTTNPTVMKGDMIVRTITRNSAGNWTLTLKSRPAFCYMGVAKVSNTSNVDLVGHVDWTTAKSAGTIVVRTMTGSVETDPANGKLVGGYLVVKRSSRARTGP